MRTNLANIASYGIDSQEKRDLAVAKRRAHLAGYGLVAPSGHTLADLKRDLDSGNRVAVEAGFITVIRKVNKNDRTMEFVCSTEGQKRDGNIVRASGFRFRNFDRNPVGTWVHRYDIFPVSRWVERQVTKVDGTPALVMTAQFVPPDADDGMGEKVYKLYQYGFLNAVSIGWEPIKYRELRVDGAWGGYEFLEQDLLECAHVLIPADADALKRACQRGVMTADECTAFARWAEIDRASAYVIAWQEKNPPHRAVYCDPDDDECRTRAAADSAEMPKCSKECECADCAKTRVPKKAASDTEPDPNDPNEEAEIAAGEKETPPKKRAKKAASSGDTEPDPNDPNEAAEGEDQVCPKCGAELSANTESCPRCGADLPGARAHRALAVARRGTLSDALDGPVDRLRADGFLYQQYVDQIQRAVDGIFYFEGGGAPDVAGPMTGKVSELSSYIDRTRRRMTALSASIDASLQEVGDVMATITADTPPPGDRPTNGSAPGIVPLAQAAIEHVRVLQDWLTRVGKKIARSRLERLNSAHDGMVASTQLLRDVIDEALTEAQGKVAQQAKEDTSGESDDAAASDAAAHAAAGARAVKKGTVAGDETEEEPAEVTTVAETTDESDPALFKKKTTQTTVGQQPRSGDEAVVAEIAELLGRSPVENEIRALMDKTAPPPPEPEPPAEDPLITELRGLVAIGKEQRNADKAAAAILAGL